MTIPGSNSTKKDGEHRLNCVYFFTSNKPGHERTERATSRSVFIPCQPMPNEDEDAIERTQGWNQFIYGDRNPKKFTYALAPYVLSDVFKERLVTNSHMIRRHLGCGPRTGLNYALPMTFVDFLLEEFKEEMAAKGLTRENWLEWIKKFWVPQLKKIHISEQQRKNLIDLYINELMDELASWTLNEVLKICKVMKSRQFQNGTPVPTFMLWKNAPVPLIQGMTVDAFATLVADFGGIKSQDAVLLDCQSNDEILNSTNSKGKKACAVNRDLMSSDTWRKCCQRLNRLDMLQFAADQEMPPAATPNQQPANEVQEIPESDPSNQQPPQDPPASLHERAAAEASVQEHPAPEQERPQGAATVQETHQETSTPVQVRAHGTTQPPARDWRWELRAAAPNGGLLQNSAQESPAAAAQEQHQAIPEGASVGAQPLLVALSQETPDEEAEANQPLLNALEPEQSQADKVPSVAGLITYIFLNLSG